MAQWYLNYVGYITLHRPYIAIRTLVVLLEAVSLYIYLCVGLPVQRIVVFAVHGLLPWLASLAN